MIPFETVKHMFSDTVDADGNEVAVGDLVIVLDETDNMYRDTYLQVKKYAGKTVKVVCFEDPGSYKGFSSKSRYIVIADLDGNEIWGRYRTYNFRKVSA
jgi:hypothetical protein